MCFWVFGFFSYCRFFNFGVYIGSIEGVFDVRVVFFRMFNYYIIVFIIWVVIVIVYSYSFNIISGNVSVNFCFFVVG